ncbi:MAG: dihydrodipicolinate synthase family protein [Planctomycetales bacterium]|nr:dihydrodipicolinate synthase family protein [Planctomycetales bacterium]
MSTPNLAGVLPVVHTPFESGGEINWLILRREVDWAFSVGADGVVAAMVSEVLRLTIDERMQLAERLLEATDGRGPVVTSVGAEYTRQAIELTQHAQRSGCGAVMAIPPVGARLSEAQTLSYFCEIAESTDLPLIVQDASSYVGGAMSIDLFIQLLDRFGPDKILFKPEAAPIGPNLSLLRDRSDGRAKIFDGSGGIYLIDAYRRGIVGTIPGVDLLDGVVALWRALKRSDDEVAYRVYFPICAIVTLQIQAGLDGFLAIEKYLLVRRGIFTDPSRRRPYAWDLDEETRREVDRLYEHLQTTLQSCQFPLPT